MASVIQETSFVASPSKENLLLQNTIVTQSWQAVWQMTALKIESVLQGHSKLILVLQGHSKLILWSMALEVGKFIRVGDTISTHQLTLVRGQLGPL